jgi:hypothetical protein
MTDMPTLTYAGLGMVALGVAGYWFLKGVKNSGTLDERVIRLLQEAVRPYQDILSRSDAMLDEERAEKRRAQDERDKINATLVTTILEINGKHEAAVAAAARETREQRERDQAKHQESLERAHRRIDECEKGHRIDQQTLATVQIEMREVRDRLFQVAQAATPGFTAPVAPVVAAPVTPGQPTFAMPAAGFTVTPGVPST